jgi:cephalosporin-C deacetylase-like acetyl esterase
MTVRLPRCSVALLTLLMHSPAVPAQAPAPTEGDKRIEKYLAAETDRLSKRVLDSATTLTEWQERRPRLRQQYFYMLGLWPLPEKTPLHAAITARREHDGIVLENLHFQSRPGLYVTANLYRPKEVTTRLPTILYLCGHADHGRDGNKSAYQDQGLWFAHHGYVCLILDTLQLGEIPGRHHGTYGIRANRDKNGQAETRCWWHSRGYTPAGVECWNGVRAIDYLLTRPEVDPERLGVTGISGGGAATFWVAAADERLKCAVPVSGMSDLESYVKHKVINGHCDCMFLYNTYQWEWTTIAALIAPRPLLFANSDNDSIFPMDGNRRIIARLRKLYGWYGKPELVEEYVSQGGHAYRPDLRVAAFKWLNKHLKGDTGPVEDKHYQLLPARSLRVFPEDLDIAKDALNGKADEVFVPKAVVNLPEKGKFPAWKASLLTELREHCFRPLPKDVPAGELVTRKITPRNKEPLEVTMIITESGIEVVDLPLMKARKMGTLHVQPTGENYQPHAFREFYGSKNVFALFTRGTYAPWTEASPPNYVKRAHVLLGRTVDAGRVRDIIATFKYLQEQEKTAPQVLGEGRAGILAAYAALLEPTIKEVVIIDPPTSHMQGPYFLNVMRVLDIPEALGLLAPNVRLTLVGARDPAFDRTAAIYRLAGAADNLRRK